MDYMTKKPTVLYGVAVMESPQQGGRAMPVRLYDDAQLESIDAYPSSTNSAFGTPVLTRTDHEQLHSPHHSIAPTTATTASKQTSKYRVLGTLSLTGIVYFGSCGGPVGSEPLISAGGPLLGLLGMLGYALLVQTPLAWMMTELCCAFPENGGFSVWVLTAFGPFWGFQVGYWYWVACVLSNAIYPSVIYTTIMDGYGFEATSAAVAFLCKVLIAIVLAIPSYIGVRFVGMSALVLLIVVSFTTLLFTVWGFADGNGAWFRLAEVKTTNDSNGSGGIDWVLLIHALFWSFDGLYSVSVIGGEVLNPARTYPRVIVVTALLTVATYLLSWVSATTADKMPWTEFSEDSFPQIAKAIGGSVLHHVILASSVLSTIAMFSCTLFFQSYMVQGMAQSRLLPSLLRKRSARFKTPQYAILLSLLTTLALLGFDFESILAMTNAFSGAVQVLIVLTMLQLRKTFPYLPRPVKMPGNVVAVGMALVPALGIFGFAIVTTLIEWDLLLVVVVFMIPGMVYPVVRQRLAGRRGFY